MELERERRHFEARLTPCGGGRGPGDRPGDHGPEAGRGSPPAVGGKVPAPVRGLEGHDLHLDPGRATARRQPGRRRAAGIFLEGRVHAGGGAGMLPESGGPPEVFRRHRPGRIREGLRVVAQAEGRPAAHGAPDRRCHPGTGRGDRGLPRDHPGHHRSPPPGKPVVAGAEDGKHRRHGRRHRPRLQQHPGRHPGLLLVHEDEAGPGSPVLQLRRFHRAGRPAGRRPDPPAAGLRPGRPDGHQAGQHQRHRDRNRADDRPDHRQEHRDPEPPHPGTADGSGGRRPDPAGPHEPLHNARDAMPEGGELLVETMRESISGKDLRVRTDMEPGEYLVIAVSDTGIGIDEGKPGAGLRAVLHDQGEGKGHGPGPGHGLRRGQEPPRLRPGVQRGRDRGAPSGCTCPSAGSPSRSWRCRRRRPIPSGPRRCWWWTTRRTSGTSSGTFSPSTATRC